MKWKLCLFLILICISLAVGRVSSANTVSVLVNVLANTPGTPVLVDNSTTSITVSWSANGNPDGTEYYIKNLTDATNSSWTIADSWIFTNLSCSTNYSFEVKARNADLAETDFSSVSTISTLACATTTTTTTTTTTGGGRPPVVYEKPSGTVFINNGQLNTTSRDVVLSLKAGANATKMAISNTIDFSDSNQELYQTTKLWTLTDGQGQKTVYVKFFTVYGTSSDTISAGINYNNEKGIVQELGQIASKIAAIAKQITNLFIPAPVPSPAESVPSTPTGPKILPNPTLPVTEKTIHPSPIFRPSIWSKFFSFVNVFGTYVNYILFLLLAFLLIILLLLILLTSR